MARLNAARIHTESLRHDFLLALRTLRKTPLSSATAIAVLAIGLGASLSVFAVAFGILLRPLPFADADRLVVTSMTSNEAEFGIHPESLGEWRTRLATAESMAGYGEADVVARGVGAPRAVRAALVEPSFFGVLGAWPDVGGLRGAEIVVSARLARRLAGSADEISEILGRTLRVSGLENHEVAATVGGVLGDDFAFPSDEVDLWLDRTVLPTAPGDRVRSGRLLVRLAPGVGIEAARVDAQRVVDELYAGDGSVPIITRARVTPVADALSGDLRPVLSATSIAAFLVLLATCGNVAILLLGRLLLRRRADAVRVALGARPWRLARAAWVESLVLSGLGAMGGWWLARLALHLLDNVARGALPRWRSVALDGTSVAATVGLALVATLLCGAVSALRAARQDATAALRSTDSTGAGSQRMQSALVTVQVALAVILVAGALLLGRSALQLWNEDAGFDASETLVARLAVDGAQLPTTELLERVRSLPGVRQAGLGSALPGSSKPMTIQVRRLTDGEDLSLLVDVVSATPGFLDAVGARIVEGRGFEPADDRAEGPDLVLSRSGLGLIQIYTGTEPATTVVGHEFPLSLPPFAAFDGSPRILGVVGDVKYTRLDQPPSAALYVPWNARPARQTAYLAVRTAGDVAILAPAVRTVLQDAAPGIPTPEIVSLRELMHRSVADRTLVLLPALGFALVALAVALSGVFAVTARAVTERRRDYAVRKALGASRRDVAAIVFRHAARFVGVGLVGGLLIATWAVHGLRGMLYGIEPLDPLSLAISVLLVALACVAASLGPMRRAAASSPSEALRGD